MNHNGGASAPVPARFRKVEVVFVEGKKVANGYKNQPKKEQKDKENRNSVRIGHIHLR